MKRRTLLIILLAFALFVILTLNSNVKAGEPEFDANTGYVLNGTQKCFFANGTHISIEARTDGQEGATIFWEEGTKNVDVPADINVFGAGHKDSRSYEDTKITMNGGTVKNVFGGGLHESNVTTSNVIINGGRITGSAVAGGANIFANSDNCANSSLPAVDSQTRVQNANLTVNNGSIHQVYGGGEGMSYTGTTSVNINGGNFDYIIAGGSNGYTGTANLKVTSGQIAVLQSVNRGEMVSADVRIAGGTVDKLYVGGETDPNVTGKINKVSLDITGGSIVNNLYLGTSEGQPIGQNGNITAVDVDIYEGATVTIANEAEFQNIPVTNYIFVTINDERYELEKGKTLKDLAELETVKNVEGKEFIKFVIKGTEDVFDENTAIENNTDLTAIYKDKPVETPTPTKAPEDITPKTGDIRGNEKITLLIAALAFAGIAICYKIKR